MIKLHERMRPGRDPTRDHGSAVRLASVARHVTDCATRPGVMISSVKLFWIWAGSSEDVVFKYYFFLAVGHVQRISSVSWSSDIIILQATISTERKHEICLNMSLHLHNQWFDEAAHTHTSLSLHWSHCQAGPFLDCLEICQKTC